MKKRGFQFRKSCYSFAFKYIKGSLVIIFQKILCVFSLKMIFFITNSADPDEIPSGSSLFAKVPI